MTPAPHFERPDMRLYLGDCIDVLREMDAESLDACVTDPPYGLGFMGKEWDAIGGGRAHGEGKEKYEALGQWRKAGTSLPWACREAATGASPSQMQSWHEAWAREVLRVLKPGGHLLAFGGTRTFHRLACAVEDAGFEVRDTLCWLYGSGFPKSLDVSKAIDAAAGAERQVVGDKHVARDLSRNGRTGDEAISPVPVHGTSISLTSPATPEAARWDGWGTALKPAFEPVILARKPLGRGTVAANVLAFGCGALNVDGCRIGTEERTYAMSSAPGGNGVRLRGGDGRDVENARKYADASKVKPPVTVAGRWPANVALDEEAAALLDAQAGVRGGGFGVRGSDAGNAMYGNGKGLQRPVTGQTVGYGDTGPASRFFYTAKASRSERGHGTTHPTVKPVALMRWLCRLVTPPGGTVLDPFLGSGTTAVAARAEGLRLVGIEREAEYLQMATRRLSQEVLDL